MTAPSKDQLAPLIDPITRAYIDAAIEAAMAPLTQQLETLITERATYKQKLNEIAADAANQIEAVKQAAQPITMDDIQKYVGVNVAELIAQSVTPLTQQLEAIYTKQQTPAPAPAPQDDTDRYTLTKAKIIRLMKELNID